MKLHINQNYSIFIVYYTQIIGNKEMRCLSAKHIICIFHSMVYNVVF